MGMVAADLKAPVGPDGSASALYWTVAGLVLLLLPVFVQLAFNLGRALLKGSLVGAREGVTTFASAFGFTILNLTFLPHHMFLSLDAIIRSWPSYSYSSAWPSASTAAMSSPLAE